MATQPNEAENTLDDANKKRSNGRRKIPIEKIQDKTRRHVTFSKRRSGLFKKAGQLSSLCGAEVAILTFSQKGRLFCFGHPNPDDVIRRYLTGDVTGCYENEEIKRKMEEGQNWKKGFWWDEVRVDEMGLDELQHFKGCLLELRKNVVDKLTGANLSFSSNQMGGSVLGNPNPDDNVGNLGFDNAPQMGMLNVNNHSDGIMVVDQDGFMSGMNVLEEQSVVGKEFDQFPSISGGVELPNFNVMGDYHHHHQIGRMEDQGSSLNYQDCSLHQVLDQYESGYF